MGKLSLPPSSSPLCVCHPSVFHLDLTLLDHGAQDDLRRDEWTSCLKQDQLEIGTANKFNLKCPHVCCMFGLLCVCVLGVGVGGGGYSLQTASGLAAVV